MRVVSDLPGCIELGADIPAPVVEPAEPTPPEIVTLWQVPADARIVTIRGKGPVVIAKTLGAELLYGLDLTVWLAGATLLSVTAVARGVKLVGKVTVDGNNVVARLGGFDNQDGAVNSCTFDFVSTAGRDSKTIFFTKV